MDKPKLTNLAKSLRDNETEGEQILWSWLRNRQFTHTKFRRQQPIGNYIVDFVCFNKKLIIEVDGGQHSNEQTMEKDNQRTKWLESEGFRVMRVWNNDIKQNPDGVYMQIKEALENS